jgi:glycosyltransferase involved in cell wall biosynthesis
MRILHVVHQYPPARLGGTEVYTQSLARLQAAAGHHVAVCCPETALAPSPMTVEEGVRVYRLEGGRRGRAEVFLSTLASNGLSAAFEGILAEERPDIVHIQHLMGLPAALVDSVVAAGIPYIITLHDYWYGCANAQLLTNYDGTLCDGPEPRFHNCGRCALARAGLNGVSFLAPAVAPLMRRRNGLLRPIFAGAAAILSATAFVRQAYAAMDFPVERVQVLPLGIDPGNVFSATRAPRWPRSPGAPLRLGYVGGLSRQKGVHHLIAAVNQLPEGAVTLSIYGDLSAFPEYGAELRQAAVHTGIQFKGLASRSEVWAALAELDALVAPTLWYETYSLVVHEAFAAGVPVIASRIGVMPEVIRDGIDGLLFPPGDVAALTALLRELIRRPEQLEALRRAIRPALTVAEHAAAVQAIYAEVVDAAASAFREGHEDSRQSP